MKVYREISLTDFEFWGGAKSRVEKLTERELLTIEDFINDFESELDWSETMINDFFWFDEEIWLEWLGITEEEWEERF